MVSKEDLQTQYSKLETGALLEITSPISGYTDLAISVAIDELKKRNVPIEEIEMHQEVMIRDPDPILAENYLIDLSFFQKFAFYIFWILWLTRLRIFIRVNFREEGFILKSQQLRYYGLSGFVFSIIGLACGNVSAGVGWFIWITGFLPVYLFDTEYNKPRQMKKLETIMESGGEFEWD